MHLINYLSDNNLQFTINTTPDEENSYSEDKTSVEKGDFSGVEFLDSDSE